MLLSCFTFFVFLHLMWTSVGLIVIWISHLSAIRALGVYGSIGTQYIKFHLQLHIDVYLYVCTLRVSVCPLDTVRELDVQQEFQKSYRVILGIFYVHSECGLFQKKVHISNFDSWRQLAILVKLYTSQI